MTHTDRLPPSIDALRKVSVAPDVGCLTQATFAQSFLLEFPVIAFDAPAHCGDVDLRRIQPIMRIAIALAAVPCFAGRQPSINRTCDS